MELASFRFYVLTNFNGIAQYIFFRRSCLVEKFMDKQGQQETFLYEGCGPAAMKVLR